MIATIRDERSGRGYVDIVFALAMADGIESGRHSGGNRGLAFVKRNSCPLNDLFIVRCGGVRCRNFCPGPIQTQRVRESFAGGGSRLRFPTWNDSAVYVLVLDLRSRWAYVKENLQ